MNPIVELPGLFKPDKQAVTVERRELTKTLHKYLDVQVQELEKTGMNSQQAHAQGKISCTWTPYARFKIIPLCASSTERCDVLEQMAYSLDHLPEWVTALTLDYALWRELRLANPLPFNKEPTEDQIHHYARLEREQLNKERP